MKASFQEYLAPVCVQEEPEALSRFRKLLGEDVFFVPCIWGTKKPLTTYVERRKETTFTEDYKSLFRRANIAVYLGEASGGLCAIDFDRDQDLADFLAVNPQLQQTTHSRGSRGGMLWVRMTGSYPESCKSPHFEWRANRQLSMIYGQHPAGMDYRLVCDLPPAQISFAEIKWPEVWSLPWTEKKRDDGMAKLEEDYGQPFYLNQEGKVTGINERYWAGLFSRENRILYDPEELAFYQYCQGNGLWQLVTEETLREAISARLLEASRESRQFTLERYITQQRLKGVVQALMGIVERRGVFRAKKRFIHVANGVLRFDDNGEVTFGEFSPDDYSRNQSPLKYDPSADCPRFLSELLYPAVSEEDADLLQRWAGLALFGHNLPQRFLILDGTPNGGKGTFVRIIQSLLGIENCYQLRTECLHDRFETFRYRRKTLLIGPDVPGDFLMHRGASMLKVLVGGDPISAEGKGLNGDYQMFGTFNIVMTCNSRLRIRLEDDSGAWRRRLLIVRYENPPPEKRILDFHETLLREEGSGILLWALAGFVKLQEEFKTIGDFVLTESQKGRIDSLLAESDSLKVFVTERIERHAYSDISNDEFQQAYAEFCSDRGWNAMPLTVVERNSKALMLEIWKAPKSHCIERPGQKASRGWTKVRLKPMQEELSANN